MLEIAVHVDETRNSVFRSDGTPAVIDALVREGEVKAEIQIGMRFGIIGDFREPVAAFTECVTPTSSAWTISSFESREYPSFSASVLPVFCASIW